MARGIANAFHRLGEDAAFTDSAALVPDHAALVQGEHKNRKRQPVEQKRHFRPHRVIQITRDRRPDETGDIEHHGIQRDGGRHMLRLYQIGHHGKPRRRVERPDHPDEKRQEQQQPFVDQSQKGQPGQRERLQHAKRLRDDGHDAPVDPIGDDTGDRRQQHGGEQIGKGHHAKPKAGLG